MENEVQQLRKEMDELKRKISMLYFSDRYIFSRDIELQTGRNIVLSTTTSGGTKLGTATSQLLGFWNATPSTQPTPGGSNAHTEGTGTAFNNNSTSTGGTGSNAYRFAEVVRALKDIGLIAT